MVKTMGELCLVLHPKFPRWLALNRSGFSTLKEEACGKTFAEICLSYSKKNSISLEYAENELSPFFNKMLDLGMLSFESADMLPLKAANVTDMFVHLLDACNLKCEHCYKDSFPGKSTFQKTDNVLSLLNDFSSLGGKTLTLSGGEPLLFPDIKRILTASAPLFSSVTLATNGTLIDGEMANLLADLGVRVQVSLDGSTKEVHNSIRGNNAFERAWIGINELLKSGVKETLTLCGTILYKNYHNILDILPLAQNLGIGAVRFIPLQSSGRGKCQPGLQAFEKEFLDNFYSFLGAYSGSVKLTGGCGGLGIFSKDKCPDGQWCTVGSKIVVDADSRVYSCALLMDESSCVGDLKRESISEIIEGSKFKSFCKVCRTRNERIPSCVSCYYKGICQSGCPGHAFQRKGTVLSPDQYCDYRKDFLDNIFFSHIAKR